MGGEQVITSLPDDVFLILQNGGGCPFDAGRGGLVKTVRRGDRDYWERLVVGDVFMAEDKSGKSPLKVRVVKTSTYQIGSGRKHVHRGYNYELQPADALLPDEVFIDAIWGAYTTDKALREDIGRVLVTRYPEGDMAEKLLERLFPSGFRSYVKDNIKAFRETSK